MKFLAVATLAFMSLAASQSETQRTVDRWQRRIQQSSELLKAGSYEKALRIADDLVNEMVERLGPGDAETESFGIVLVHKALAHAGLGHEQEAIWYWHLAIDLYKDLAAADLSAHGKAGVFLKEHPPGSFLDDPNVAKARTREL